MRKSVPEPLIGRVAALVDAYQLLPNATVPVACSGGKDSIFTCIALRQLGYEVRPVLVDMGYERSWSNRVADALASLGFDSVVLNARAEINNHVFGEDSLFNLTRNIELLDSIDVFQSVDATPCTSCYNSKVLLLENYLLENGFDRVAFGHHASDAASSFLKSALMYVDRWESGNLTFIRSEFRRLAITIRNNMEQNADEQVEHLRRLAEKGFAATDEAPMQNLKAGSNLLIVRPIFDVWESEIIEFSRDLDVTIEGSGCGHSISLETQTPREIALFEIVRPAEAGGYAHRFHELVTSSIDSRGFSEADPRRSRAELLGNSYKPGVGGVEKL